MNFRTILYTLKQGLVGVWRNRMMSLASIGSVTSTLIILGIILVLVLNVNNLAVMLEQEFDEIEIFIAEDATKEQIENLNDKLENINGISEIRYKSKEEALKDMQEQWDDKAYLLEDLEENPFPDSLIIRIDNIEESEKIVKSVKNMEGIEDIKYFRDIIEKMVNISTLVRNGGLVIIGILVLISIFIISNTIKITVAARKKEINIMKYVGATNGFIRGPFIVEGILLGIIGSIVSIFIIEFSYKYLFEVASKQLYVFSNVYMIPYYNLFGDVVLIFMSIGIGIGIIGSVVSLRRFLKV
ncbi:permease-like cell division protein FtsX [Clostridium sp. D2Q-14]|uniref:permease-like cell division protein FtsX n=1 Tax=Anaeromonas gelatinilytica TaxID=2683194 RepID=UPI00193AEE8D|nr:permease-like cell division protein FtsX [Anaeromonas gelatinilytica]MBS4534811.1 permease-like cell division protein FtsX [Anaeromonas gelatinilytica]